MVWNWKCYFRLDSLALHKQAKYSQLDICSLKIWKLMECVLPNMDVQEERSNRLHLKLCTVHVFFPS